MRLLFVLAGTAGVLLAQYAKPPETYVITQVNSMFGPSITMEVSRDGNKAVVDNISSNVTRTYYDLQAGKNYSWDPKNVANGCSAGRFSGDWGDPFALTAEIQKASPKDSGTDTVNGIPAKVLALSMPGQPPMKAWVDAKYGLVLKLEAGGKTLVETKKASFAKPAIPMAPPASCAGQAMPQTEGERIAAETGGPASDFTNAVTNGPSGGACTVVFRAVEAGSMKPITGGFQVAVDKSVDQEHMPSYQMGVGTDGHITYSGGGLKELTSQMQNGMLRIEGTGPNFDIELGFGNAGSGGGLIHRQCFGPQTVLLFVVKNPAKLSDGGDWLFVKSGKWAK